MSKTDHFFVYGTLKEGGHFAPEFDPFRVRSQVATIKGFNLFNLGWFPGIVEGDGKVVGEIHEYENLDFVQRRMDGIEGYREGAEDSSLFIRRKVTVVTEDGKEVEANAYLFNKGVPSNAEKIEDGVWDLVKYAR
jgi:gamma-glutamylcyclotransferase (GGCT)/AIG2-like uncharacterized protein YtfP